MLHFLKNKIKLFFLKEHIACSKIIIDYSELEKLPSSVFDDIFTGKLDYLLIRNFITKDEIKSFKKNNIPFLKDYNKLLVKKNDRSFIGLPILETTDKKEHFKIAKEYKQNEEKILGFSYNERIIKVLSKITSLQNIEIPKDKTGNEYLGNSVRFLDVTFSIHIDKIVFDTHIQSEELRTMMSPENILSFYSVLKNPIIGGRLFLFNKLHKDTPENILEQNAIGNFKVVENYIYQYDVTKIKVNEGDLILFDAGQRWHLIEPMLGYEKRISIGCNTSYNKEKTKIYFWS